MQIEGDGFTLRPWRDGDQHSLVTHGSHAEVARNLTDRFPYPYTDADADAWIALQCEMREPTHFAIEVAGEPVGGIGFERQGDLSRLCAEVGYWLGPTMWGRGLATGALELTSAFAFAEYDFERLEAGVLAWNPASCRVLEKAGYTLEAILRRGAVKHGEIVDRHLYARLRR